MSTLLTDVERRRLRRIVKFRRGSDQFYRARALLALDKGRPIEDVAKLLRVGLIKARPGGDGRNVPGPAQAGPTFEQDLDYLLEKNAELYRRLAQ